MDRAFYANALAMAERHVAEGLRQIASQRRIIAELKERSADTTEAEHLLMNFLSIQRHHEDDRERFIAELIKLGDADAHRT